MGHFRESVSLEVRCMWDPAKCFEILNLGECSLLTFLLLGLWVAMDSRHFSSTVRNKSFRSLLCLVMVPLSSASIHIPPCGTLLGF